jgi:hypothetical protein
MSAFSTYIKDFGTKNAATILWFTLGLLLGAFVL